MSSDRVFMLPKKHWGGGGGVGGGHKVLTLLSVRLLVGHISSILFEVGIPNLMCGCILG